MPDKTIFAVDKLPVEEYAESIGLLRAPSLKFLKSEEVQDREKVGSGCCHNIV